MYATGKGVAKNDKKMFSWFQKAALQGNADGQYSLGVMYARGQGVGQSDKKAFNWIQKAAEQGNARAQGQQKAQELYKKKFNKPKNNHDE